MAIGSTRTPKETIKVRRLPKKNEELDIRVRVTRTGRNSWDTADTVTIHIPGYDYPVTVNWEDLTRTREQ